MKCYAYDNADKRRRDRRKGLTEAWNREHKIPDAEYQPPHTILSRRRHKPIDRVQAAVNPISFDYRAQIKKASEYHQGIADESRRIFTRRVKSPYGLTAKLSNQDEFLS